LPQAYFLGRIGGQHVQADVLVGPGQDPHIFEPTPQQMAGLSEAAVYFRIGMPFETRLLAKIASVNKDLKVVDTAEGIELMDMPEDEAGRHHEAEGAAEARARGDKDPHIWLDPKLVKIQAQTICRALVELDPANADTYRANLKAFQDELDRLDQRLAKVLAPLKGREFFVYHPAFGYFAAAYGLKQVAVETGGKEPGPRRVAELVEQARREGVNVIFVQPQFSDKTARAIARQIGGAVVPIDDLPRDYVAGMDKMSAAIEQALGKAAP
jgi:zinc transport system substrate-binding protein